MSEPLYSIGTWDTDLGCYTPQIGVPSINLTRRQLVESMRELQQCGYSCHRTGNTDQAVRDSDTYVLIERTDGKSEAEILRDWER